MNHSRLWAPEGGQGGDRHCGRVMGMSRDTSCPGTISNRGPERPPLWATKQLRPALGGATWPPPHLIPFFFKAEPGCPLGALSTVLHEVSRGKIHLTSHFSS